MQIGELSKLTGISRDTLRFYEKQGLLRSSRKANGYRYYAIQTVNWLGYLRLAQSLGFTLAEIKSDLHLLAAPDLSDAVLRGVMQNKLDEMDRKIESLQQLRGAILERLNTPTDCPFRASAEQAE